MLVAARLQPAIIAEVSEKAIMDGWHNVMKIFKHFSGYSRHATRCAAAVSVFFDKVLPQRLDDQRLSTQQSRSTRRPQQQQQLEGSTRSQSFRAASTPHAAFADPGTNTGDSATLDEPMMVTTGAAEVDGGQDWVFNSYQNMGEYDLSVTDYSSMVGMFDTSDPQVDLGGMSWLTSLPSQLYGNSVL